MSLTFSAFFFDSSYVLAMQPKAKGVQGLYRYARLPGVVRFKREAHALGEPIDHVCGKDT